MKRRGLLLAVSSLPGKYGIGDFGSEIFSWIKILKNNHIDLWQILPLNPIGYGHCPYQPFSSFAFDEIYISIEDLQKKKLIGRVNKVVPRAKVDYSLAREIKEKAIEEAFSNFIKNSRNKSKLRKFEKENVYAKEYAEFVSLKEMNKGEKWNKWKIQTEDNFKEFENRYLKHLFAQFILLKEWNKIRKFANKNNIKIIGDVPFYVGYDSSDVYFHEESFLMDEKHNPTRIAGVPPDYFSKEGQRWGNPIWNFEYLCKNDFGIMMDRILFASSLYDIVRIDHFRAFDSYWSINPECETALDGYWCYPDGYGFFNLLLKKNPSIELIVEDLGDLRQEVLELRDHFNFPGVRVLEFSINDDEFENKRIEKENSVYYSSTHDNETLNEWLHNMDMTLKMKLVERVNSFHLDGRCLEEKLINYCLNRKEDSVIIPVSDILNLDKNHRMNVPGISDESNWRFKLKDFSLISRRLRRFYK